MKETNASRQSWLAWTRASASVCSVVLLVTLLAPVGENWADKPTDGFPLSYYPMFTKRRGATTKIHHAVAVLASGDTIDIPARYAGPGGMNTNRRQMRKAVRKGRAEALAHKIARRFQRRGKDLGAMRIQVVTSEYAVQDYFRGRTAPVSRVVHADIPALGVVAEKTGE